MMLEAVAGPAVIDKYLGPIIKEAPSPQNRVPL